jgi:hypothetical protein
MKVKRNILFSFRTKKILKMKMKNEKKHIKIETN